MWTTNSDCVLVQASCNTSLVFSREGKLELRFNGSVLWSEPQSGSGDFELRFNDADGILSIVSGSGVQWSSSSTSSRRDLTKAAGYGFKLQPQEDFNIVVYAFPISNTANLTPIWSAAPYDGQPNPISWTNCLPATTTTTTTTSPNRNFCASCRDDNTNASDRHRHLNDGDDDDHC
jgi:hypothetical protein